MMSSLRGGDLEYLTHHRFLGRIVWNKKLKNSPFLRDIIYEQGLGDIHKLGNALGSRGQKSPTKISKI
jgi:hypothetical protein